MKKIYTIILASFLSVLATEDLGAQNLPSFQTREFGKLSPTPGLAESGFADCNQLSVFGQPPFLLSVTGFPSIILPDGTTFMAVDNYSGIINPVNGITFWGIFEDAAGGLAVPAAPMHFRIYFFGDFVGGDTIYRADLFLTAQSELVEGMPVCRFDATFPETVNLPAAGLVSVVNVFEPGPDFFTFYWIASFSGDMISSIYFLQFGQIVMADIAPFDWALCLDQAPVAPPPVPLSNWAVLIGVLLIMVTFIFRYRR